MADHRIALWLLLTIPSWSGLHGSVRAQEEAAGALVQMERGELPIILSAPHDGNRGMPDLQPRTGRGLVAQPGGFVTARDTGTAPLAEWLFQGLEKRFGRKPYLVINRLHRKYMDPNRAPNEAYEQDASKRIYEQYHEFLDQACREVKDKYHAGLLLDIHGQGSRADTVFRGTKDGLTVQLLRERFGESSHGGDESFLAMLRRRQFTVHPDPHDGSEQAGFTGGFIVRNYGSHSMYGIDAMQLEFGNLYRVAENRESASAVLTDAVAEYAAKYLKLESEKHEMVTFQPKVAVQPKAEAKAKTPRGSAAIVP
jgi:N-formylglutamate amidohydrolase